jgi:DNA-binding response OmpR family regulator
MDLMMPGMDGYAVCEAMRCADRETPIVFLSALDAEDDQIRGLDAGADDYVSKTASPALLEARIRKALERADRFSKMDAPAAMTKTEADIYRLLESDCGRFFSYREIFSAVCGEGYFADEGAIRVHVSNMRKKLPADERLVAKRGVGYALVRG